MIRNTRLIAVVLAQALPVINLTGGPTVDKREVR